MSYRANLLFNTCHSPSKYNTLTVPYPIIDRIYSSLGISDYYFFTDTVILLSANSKKIAVDITEIHGSQEGIHGSESIKESLGLKDGVTTEFIFFHIKSSYVADEVTFKLLADKSYTHQWVSDMYKNNYNKYKSPEESLKLEFLESILYNGNIFKINIMGKNVIVQVECVDDMPMRVADTTKIIFKLHDQSKDKLVLNGFEDVYGMQYLFDFLKWRVFVPLAYRTYHVNNNIKPPTGVLLWGPSGCGKTFVAKKFIKICKSQQYTNFLYAEKLKDYEFVHPKIIFVSPVELLSDNTSQTLKNIKNLFTPDFNCPKVVFIDEIDTIVPNRESYIREVSYVGRHAFVSLLAEMDNLVQCRQNIVIIGLTNNPKNVDNVLRRPGRFECEFYVGVPKSSQRLEIIKGLMKNIKNDLNDKQLEDVSNQTSAFVAADIDALIQKAVNDKNKANLEGKASNITLTYDDIIEARKTLRPSALREVYVEIPQTLWTDIGGYEDVKLMLKQSIEWPFTHREIFSKFNIKPPKGILLYGPPGTGKTLMAKAVATSSHMNFVSVKGPELFSKWVGESEKSLRHVFSIARSNAPCVIFFDEIDSMGKSRQTERSSEVGNRLLSQLLNEMDGINTIEELVIIGATNRPDMLDPALLRPGRFDRLIYVKLPDIDSRRHILKINLSKMSIDPSIELEKLIDDLSEQTDGLSGAEIECICREAGLESITKHIISKTDNTLDKIYVKMEDIYHSFNKLHHTNIDKLIEIYNNFNV